MNNLLLSSNAAVLRNLLGEKIISVTRQLFKDDMDLDDYEQSADGPVELTMTNGSVLHFIAFTEACSVGVVSGGMPRYGDSYEFRDLTMNLFWGGRVGQELRRLNILKISELEDPNPCEAVDIIFQNGERVVIEYISDEENLDMIRVTDRNLRSHSIRQIID